MIIKKYLHIWMILLFFTSCLKKDDDINKLHGFSELTSNTILNLSNDTRYGFSFDKAGVILYPNSSDIIPDFIIRANSTYNHNNDIQAFFNYPSFVDITKFYLLNEFENTNNAIEYFDNISELDFKTESARDSIFIELSPNQIWLIKTKYSNYGIIRIINTSNEVFEYNTKSVNSVNIYFEWKYQPNGTLKF